MIPWKLHFTGKLFHSGLAHKVVSTLMVTRTDEVATSALIFFFYLHEGD